jgi:hypothetical protein
MTDHITRTTNKYVSSKMQFCTDRFNFQTHIKILIEYIYGEDVVKLVSYFWTINIFKLLIDVSNHVYDLFKLQYKRYM